jgi:putative membrane protein
MSEKKEKVLVLCVDRDNDIGVKTGVTTPLIGRTENLDGATQLALTDPEESDANAIFGAVQFYDELTSDVNLAEYEVATIVGSNQGGITADRTIRDQLLAVLDAFPANNVVLVTDGFSDEAVIPIIQSQISILSIKRIVVRHSESIEESWMLLSRYLRKAVEDPYYSRWIFGAPGVLLLIMGLLWHFVEVVNPSVVLLVVVGALLLIKGFSIDKVVVEYIYPSPLNLVRLFTTSTSLVIGGLAVYQTYGILLENVGGFETWLPQISLVVGYVLKYAADLIFISFTVFIGGLSVYLYFMRDSRMLWSIVGLVVGVFMREVALHASEILLLEVWPVPMDYWIELTAIIASSIIITIVTVFVTLRQGRRLEEYFKKTEE